MIFNSKKGEAYVSPFYFFVSHAIRSRLFAALNIAPSVYPKLHQLYLIRSEIIFLFMLL